MNPRQAALDAVARARGTTLTTTGAQSEATTALAAAVIYLADVVAEIGDRR